MGACPPSSRGIWPCAYHGFSSAPHGSGAAVTRSASGQTCHTHLSRGPGPGAAGKAFSLCPEKLCPGGSSGKHPVPQFPPHLREYPCPSETLPSASDLELGWELELGGRKAPCFPEAPNQLGHLALTRQRTVRKVCCGLDGGCCAHHLICGGDLRTQGRVGTGTLGRVLSWGLSCLCRVQSGP